MSVLGTFVSLQEVWEKYPNGGKEGDVLTINGILCSWDKYNLIWVVDGDEPVSSGYPLRDIDGDFSIQNDLYIGGVLHANNIETSSKGLFSTETDLKIAFPTPKDGDWAIVGDIIPGPIWRGDNNVWINTGEIGGGADINLNRYVKNEVLKDKVKELNNTIENKIQVLDESIDSHVKDLNTAIKNITPILLPEKELEELIEKGKIDETKIYYGIAENQ